MPNNRAQISIEYMILTGFIVLAIIVPTVLFLFSVTNTSVEGKIGSQKVNELGNGLVNDAKSMYYLGLYSNKISEYEIPANTKNISIVRIEETTPAGPVLYYYLAILIDDTTTKKVYYFQSDVPITSDSDLSYVNNDNEPDLISECQDSDKDCTYYNFLQNVLYPGVKKFKIETIYDKDIDGTDIVKSSIIPVLT